jgi:hypothetical protein
MTLAGAWQIIKTAFETSPYLAAMVALILWLGFCWKFRLVAIGRRRSLPTMLLAEFEVSVEQTEPVTLDTLHAVTVKPKRQGNPAAPTEGKANGEEVGAEWNLAEVYQIYWTLVARGEVIRYTTTLIAFAALALFVMFLAQPTASVSLLNVANAIGVAAFLPLAILFLLSLVLILLSAHQLPCDVISKTKPQTIMLFAW